MPPPIRLAAAQPKPAAIRVGHAPPPVRFGSAAAMQAKPAGARGAPPPVRYGAHAAGCRASGHRAANHGLRAMQPFGLTRPLSGTAPALSHGVVQRMLAQVEVPKNVPLDRIRELITKLNAACPGEWAFSGSFALWLYANEKGVAFRLPGDIDVLVTQHAYMAGTFAFYSETDTSFAGMGKKGWTAPFAPDLDIDWIVERSDRGKLRDCHMHAFPGLGTVPVIRLDALASLKGQMADTTTKKGIISGEDLEVIKRLL